MTAHATPEALEAWVLGTLEPAEAQALEAHALECPACAQALEKEAAFEQRLHALAVAPRARAVSRLSRAQRPALYAATLMAAAAAVTLFLRVKPLTFEHEPRVVRCQDASCEAKARFDGVLSLGPDGELKVPRYEDVPESANGSRGGK
jgi:hypothetical protein